MTLGHIDHSDFLKEKTLWQIYKAARVIKDSRFNSTVWILVAVAVGTYAFCEKDTLRAHAMLVSLATTGFNSALAILGFLIAGFTIFASLANPRLLLLMAHQTHLKTRLSFLKYNFFSMLRVFIFFLVFTAFQGAILLFGQSGGILTPAFEAFPELAPLNWWGNRILLIVSAAFWAFVFLQLKSFVFNVHHFVMTMIRFAAVEHNEALAQKDRTHGET
jgi:hypothetical protein